MVNRFISQPPTDMILARLEVMLESVNTIYKTGGMVLQDDIINSYHLAMSTFFESLDKSITATALKVITGTPPDPVLYNTITNSIRRDIDALFAETNALDKIITSSFNSIIAAREQTLQISRRVSNKLGDYLLYSDPTLGAGYFFGDSFNTADKLDIGSSLADEEECYHDTDEGIIFLPKAGEPDRPSIKSYIVNKPSNGTPGNNLEIGVVGHDEIEALGDNEPNTWYEYEKVTIGESSTPLVLDITIVLETISVINHININPINFGTPSPVKIVDITTSRDGIEYSSIKDEIPLKDFVSEDDKDEFELSAATSKYAGQGFYSFLPRKVQYIHIVFKQHTPYQIETLNGSRLRYAIGLRDINILGRKFNVKGSIVSIPFSAPNEIKKVSVWASENPVEASELADITHSISADDGSTWIGIQPQRRAGTIISEVINFNNITENAVITDLPVDTLRHKIKMERYSDAFNGPVVLKEEKIPKLDIVDIPTGGDFTVNTTEEFISETVNALLPFYGSFSCPRDRTGTSIRGLSTPMDLDFVEFNVDVPGDKTVRFSLPWKQIPYLDKRIRVFVNGEQIEYVAKTEDALGRTAGITSYTSYNTIQSDSKVYFLNKAGRELQFGHIIIDPNGGHDIQAGFVPEQGSRIQVCLDGDNPRLELTDQGYVLNLSTPSDGNKAATSIIGYTSAAESEALDYSFTLPPGTRKIEAPVPPSTRPSSSSSANTKQSQLLLSMMRVGQISEEPPESSQRSYNSITSDSNSGVLPKIFLEGTSNFVIEEYSLATGNKITSPFFDTPVDYIDGDEELRNPSSWTLNETSYSFDADNGMVYLGSEPLADRKTVLRCKALDADVVSKDKWKFYRNPVTHRIDTQKIILDPTVVYTSKATATASVTAGSSVRSINLTEDNEIAFDWFNKKVVKGTVVIGKTLLPDNVDPVEVPFVNGETELTDLVNVNNETIVAQTGSGPTIYTFTLSEPDTSKLLEGSPQFIPVRLETESSAPTSQFLQYVAPSSLALTSTDGDWTYEVDATTKVVTVSVKLSTSLRSHLVSYIYRLSDPGVDRAGLHSIDYENGIIYFAEDIENNGTVSFEFSLYSAFYNIAEAISSGDIVKKDPANKELTLSTSLGMRFLKLNTADKARPPYLVFLYDFYRKSTESLKDLEPYFSPICKDIAFRAITTDVLEEL